MRCRRGAEIVAGGEGDSRRWNLDSVYGSAIVARVIYERRRLPRCAVGDERQSNLSEVIERQATARESQTQRNPQRRETSWF